jgi:hypothetical protein
MVRMGIVKRIKTPRPVSMKVKTAKQEVMDFLASKDFQKHRVILSQKRLSGDAKMGSDYYGEVDVDNPEADIIINPHKGNLTSMIDTIVHELLHILKPAAKEAAIRQLAHDVYHDLSPMEISTILAFAFSKVIWDEVWLLLLGGALLWAMFPTFPTIFT